MPGIAHSGTASERNNEALLRLESLLLNGLPGLVTSARFAELAACGVGEELAYALLLAGAFGLRPDENEADREFVNGWLLPSLHKLQASDYLGNPYIRQIHFPEVRRGTVEMSHAEYAPCEAFACGDLYFDGDRLRAPLGFFTAPFRYPVIRHKGREWMTVTPNEINTMHDAVEAAAGHVLVYGLGLGYYPFMAAAKPEVESVTVVEVDEQIISLFEELLLPQFPQRDKVTVLHDDAFAHAGRTAFRHDGVPFETVFTDLWHDVGDGIDLYRRMRSLQQRHAAAGQRFLYWIEPSIRCYLDA